MDPNTTLLAGLKACHAAASDPGMAESHAEDARDAFTALADWIDRGGFVPALEPVEGTESWLIPRPR